MNQEMTFGQAVDWIGADKSRVVQLHKGETLLRFNSEKQRFEVSCDDSGWEVDNNMSLNFMLKWRPYVAPNPKSVIEEAIEREMKRHLFTVPSVKAMCCAVANATLDEAIALCVENRALLLADKIKALKVTL